MGRDSPFGFPKVAPTKAGFSTEGLRHLDEWIEGYLQTNKLAQLSFALLRDGNLVYGRCAGTATHGLSAPTTPTTIHRIFSMTKPVTGVAVMILLERALCKLDDPIAQYLPEFSVPQVLTGDGTLLPAIRPISIRHLLTHTAGLTYGFLESGPVDTMLRDSKLDAVPGQVRADSLAQWCTAVAEFPLVAHPGSQWQYSVAMDVLGRLVEVLSHRPFDEFLREEILHPLGMVDTDFFVPKSKHHRLATCYRQAKDGPRPIERTYKPFYQPPEVPLGGGGLVSTMVDYLRFAEMLRRGGTLGEVQILQPETVDLMTRDHLAELPLAPGSRSAPMQSLASVRSFRGDGFGLTGMVTLSPEESGVLGPPGPFSWGGAASTSFWIDRTNNITAVQLAQLIPSGTHPLRQESRNLVYGALL